jgi:hypothetical protein
MRIKQIYGEFLVQIPYVGYIGMVRAERIGIINEGDFMIHTSKLQIANTGQKSKVESTVNKM